MINLIRKIMKNKIFLNSCFVLIKDLNRGNEFEEKVLEK